MWILNKVPDKFVFFRNMGVKLSRHESPVKKKQRKGGKGEGGLTKI